MLFPIVFIIFTSFNQRSYGQFFNTKCPEFRKNQTLEDVNVCFSKLGSQFTTDLIAGVDTLEVLLCKTIEEKAKCQISILEDDKDCFETKESVDDRHLDYIREVLWDVFEESATLGQNFLDQCSYLYNEAEKLVLSSTGSLTCDYEAYYLGLKDKIKCEDAVDQEIINKNVILQFLTGSAWDNFYSETRCDNQNEMRECQLQIYQKCNYQEKEIREIESRDGKSAKEWEERIRANLPSFRWSNCNFTIGDSFEDLAPVLGLPILDNDDSVTTTPKAKPLEKEDDDDDNFKFLTSNSRDKRSAHSHIYMNN